MSLKLGNTTIAGISRETKLNAHSLLDFKWTDHILNEMSWLRADTFSWQSGDVYTSVYNLLVTEYNSGTEETEGSITFKRSPNGYKITTDESGVSALFINTGVAWYYILDTENRRFKLPRTKYGFTGLRDGVGNYVPESLPNHKHQINAWVESGTATAKLDTILSGNSTNTPDKVFNTSKVYAGDVFDSSTYQDNAPVQQRATQMYLYFYVGQFSQTAIEETAGLNSTMFNNKVDKDDLAEVVCIIDPYVNGYSGYNVYSNGYCEQWGRTIAGSSNTKNIVLLKEFKDIDYNVTFGSEYTSTATATPQVKTSTKLTNSFDIIDSTTTTQYSYWKACGYLADGEY